MYVLRLVVSSLLFTLSALGEDLTINYPDKLAEGPVFVETVSRPNNLDGPKIPGAANKTTYDWWYFDSTSEATNASLVVTLYNDGPDGFPQGKAPLPLGVTMTGSYHNGTLFAFVVPATNATVVNNQNGISGIWEGTGWSFTGTLLYEPNPTYVIHANSPGMGVYGTITYQSRAPAHYTCNLNVPYATEMVFPGVYWANAIPDAHVTVDLIVAGEPFKYSDGFGYHDKNWGNRPFSECASSWFWGHGRLGDYSVTFFDTIDIWGTHRYSSYVAKAGDVLVSTCAKESETVRPWGANSTYPPTNMTGPVEGIEVQFDLGDGSMLMTNWTTRLLIQDTPIYARMTGWISGYIDGANATGETWEGISLFEEIHVWAKPPYLS